VLLPTYLGLEPTGGYFLAYRVLALPISVLSAAVAQVFFAEAARNNSPTTVQTMTRSVATLMCALGMPFYLGMIVLGPDAFTLAFGDRWGEAGACARILAPALLLRMVATTLSSLLTISERYVEALGYTALEVVGTLLAVWVGVQANSIAVFVLTSSLISVPLYFVALRRFVRVVGIRLRDLLVGSLGPVLLLNVPGALLLLLESSCVSPLSCVVLWFIQSIVLLLISSRLPGLRSLWPSANLGQTEWKR
jgi:O-antigen/teichoic acid export membrane protein